MDALFLALIEQKLHPEADAEDGQLPHPRFDVIGKPRLFQIFHARGKAADPGRMSLPH